MKVLVYNEFFHERMEGTPASKIYPNGIHEEIKSILESEEITVETVTLDDVATITPERLATVDVLVWWGHMKHGDVPDGVAAAVRDAVLSGMGALFLHSAHHSKPFKTLMGTSGNLTWRESGDREILWVTEPSHPITRGIDRCIKLDAEETYGEPFVIPTPDKLLFISNFSGGEVFRSGCLYERGCGKVFYFQPGHEDFPTYKHPDVRRVIKNAVEYLKPDVRLDVTCPHVRHIDSSEPYVI